MTRWLGIWGLLSVLLAYQISEVRAGDDRELAGLKTFLVDVDDDVRNGCWTNTKASKAEVERLLLTSGFKVAEEDESYDAHIVLHGTGFAIGENVGCSVVAEFGVFAYLAVELPWQNSGYKELVIVELETCGQTAYFGVRRSNPIKGIFSDCANEFIVKVLKASSP